MTLLTLTTLETDDFGNLEDFDVFDDFGNFDDSDNFGPKIFYILQDQLT